MAKAKRTTSPKSDQQLGTLIAAVLNHPDLPEDVYNALGDSLTDLLSKPGYGDRPETIQAVIDAAKERASEPKAAEQGQSEPAQPSDGEPELRLTIDQYLRLEEVWFAIDELAQVLSPPDCEGGGVKCLAIVNNSLGEIVHELERQKKGGAA